VEFALELVKRDGREVRRPAQELLEQVSLGERADYFPNQLSGGEQQRANQGHYIQSITSRSREGKLVNMKKATLKVWHDVGTQKYQFAAIIVIVLLAVASSGLISAYENLNASVDQTYDVLRLDDFTVSVEGDPTMPPPGFVRLEFLSRSNLSPYRKVQLAFQVDLD
jgi:ABC-type hemin transport system ATPase subunit